MLTVLPSDLIGAPIGITSSASGAAGISACATDTQCLARLKGAATSNYPFAISSSLFTVFQLRVVAFTASAFSNTAFESLVSP